MARSVGVAPADAAALFSKFRIGGIIPMRAEKMAQGDLTATFELTMARNDIRLMIEAAGREPLTVHPAIAARMDEAIAAGHGKDDMGAIALSQCSTDAMMRPLRGSLRLRPRRWPRRKPNRRASPGGH